MRWSKFPADMHNYIWCPIYIPSYMITGSVVSEELRWQDFGMDGRTYGQSDCTPRPAFAFGDAGKKFQPTPPPRKFFSSFAPGYNLHLVLGLSSFYVRFSSHASRIVFFVYVCCYEKQSGKMPYGKDVLKYSNIQQPMLGVPFRTVTCNENFGTCT